MGSIVDRVDVRHRPPGELRSVLVSLIFHLLVALGMWWLVYDTVIRQSISLTSSSAPADNETSIAFTPAPMPPAVESLSPTETMAAIDPLQMTGADTTGWSENLLRSLTPPSIDFFGTQAYGTRFVFVLDVSFSMDARDGARYRRACDELIRSVSRLSSEQSYYVFVFCWETSGMFYDASAHYVAASGDHLEKLRDWIYDVRLGSGTDPRRALALARQMNPDAVFLLTDGDFNQPSTPLSKSGWIDPAGLPFEGDVISGVQRLFGEPRIPIHTIAFENPFSLTTMEEIAALSGGSFRYVKTSSHEPVDSERFAKILSEISSLARADSVRGSRRGSSSEDRGRLRYARELIGDGELVYAEYIFRAVEPDNLLAGYDKQRWAEIHEILEAELGSLRLEDFETPPAAREVQASLSRQ